jgi:hypothetical protein
LVAKTERDAKNGKSRDGYLIDATSFRLGLPIKPWKGWAQSTLSLMRVSFISLAKLMDRPKSRRLYGQGGQQF